MLLNLMVNHPHISPRLLKNIVCKTLVIEGKRDVIKPSHTKLISDFIPNADHVIIPDSGHNVFCDNVAFTNKTIVDFFS
jgi:pimeloyl-ACP methyl ester carboxylesterase